MGLPNSNQSISKSEPVLVIRHDFLPDTWLRTFFSLSGIRLLTPSDFHLLNQNVLAGAIFFWNQYSNIVRTKLSSTALTVRVIIKKVNIL